MSLLSELSERRENTVLYCQQQYSDVFISGSDVHSERYALECVCAVRVCMSVCVSCAPVPGLFTRRYPHAEGQMRGRSVDVSAT